MGQCCASKRPPTDDKPVINEDVSSDSEEEGEALCVTNQINPLKASQLWRTRESFIAKQETKESTDDVTYHKLAVFTWRLPERSMEHITLLCYGYIRKEATKFIPNDIIHICTSYTNDNSYIMHKIKNSSNQSKFDSPIFTFQSMMFMMSVYPKGKHAIDDDCMWSLKLISEHSIKLRYSLTFCELNNRKLSNLYSELKNRYTEIEEVICTNKEIKELESLTVIFHIHTLQTDTGKWFDNQYVDIRTHNNETVNLNESIFSTVPYRFKWKIYDMDSIKKIHDTRVQSIYSPLYEFCGFKWHLKLCPNHELDTFSLCLSLSSFAPNLQKIVVKYRLYLDSSELEHSKVAEFNPREFSGDAWSISKSKTDLNHLMFTVFIEILHVYERYEEIITQNYLVDHYTEDVTIASYDSDTFTWNLPFTSAHNAPLVVSGYWRMHSPYVHLDNELLNLSAAYLHYNFLRDIHSYHHCESLQSKPFIIGGLRWMIKIYPRGVGEDGSASNGIYLCLLSMSAKVDRVTLLYTIEIPELDVIASNVLYIENSEPNKRNALHTNMNMEHLQHDDCLSIVVTLAIMDRFDDGQEGRVMEKERIMPTVSLHYDDHEWKVADKQTVNDIKHTNIASGQHFTSPIFVLFGLKWFIDIYPDGTQKVDRFGSRSRYTKDRGNFRFFIKLVSVPPNVRRIFFEYELQIKEIDLVFHHITNFSSFRNEMMDGWHSSMLKKSDVQDMNQFTFVVRMRMIDVFGFTGKRMTKSFIQRATKQICRSSDKQKSYIWRIGRDSKALKTLEQKSTQRNIYSPRFEIYGLKWCLEMIVNRREGISLRLWITNLSTSISKVVVKYKLSTSLTADTHEHFASLNARNICASWDLNKKILSINERLTCKVDIVLIEICGNTKRDSVHITQKYRNAPPQKNPTPRKPSSYTWKVAAEIMQQCAAADSGEVFTSDVFIIDGLKWIIKLFPNGRYLSGSVKIYLHCVSMMPEIMRAIIKYKVECAEIGSVYSNIKLLSKYSYARSCDGVEPYQHYDERLRNKQMKDLKSLSVKVSMVVLDVFNQKGKSWMDYIHFRRNNELAVVCDSFCWRITDTQSIDDIKCCVDNQCFMSPIFELFGLKWCLEFYPNGDNEHNKERKLCLREASWPVNISSLYFSYAMHLKEANISWKNGMASMEYYRLNACWDDKVLRNTNILQLESFTFVIEIGLVDVYDTDGINMTSLQLLHKPPHKQRRRKKKLLPETRQFSWIIDAKQLLDDVKNAQNVYRFNSQPFHMCSLRWYLQLVVDKHQKLSLHLWIASISPNIENIVVKYQLCCKEIKKENDWTIHKYETSNLSFSWAIGNVKDMKHIIASVEQLTFTLNIALIDVYDEKTRLSVTDKYINEETKETGIECKEYNKSESYCWKLCSRSKQDTLYLCCGYIRTYAAQSMEHKILILCTQYLYYDIISDIKNAQDGELFTSDIFVLHGLKWAFEFYPNGPDYDYKHSMDITLCSVSCAPNISQLFALCEITIDELDFVYSNIEYWRVGTASSLVEDDMFHHKDIQHITNTLTITIKMTIMDIYDKDGFNNNVSIPKAVLWPNACATDILRWDITDKDTMKRIQKQREGEMFCSDLYHVHGLKWYLEFYPKDHIGSHMPYTKTTALCVRLASVPPNISKVFVRCKIVLKESNTKYESFNCLEASNCNIRWPKDTLDTDAIAMLDTLSFCVEITMIDVYDKEAQIITETYVNNKGVYKISPSLLYTQKTKIWKVSDTNSVHNLQLIPNDEAVESDIFEMDSLQFKMKLFPNGCGSDSMDFVDCFFYLISLSPDIDAVAIKYTLCLIETDTFYSNCVTFCRSKQTFAGWPNNRLSNQLIQNKLDSLTIKLDINIIDIFHNEATVKQMTDTDTDTDMKSELETEKNVRWLISDDNVLHEIKTAPPGWNYSTKFEINQVTYNIQLFPNGIRFENEIQERGKVQIKVNVEALPQHIGGISLLFCLRFKETNTAFSNYLHFNKDNLSLIAKEHSSLKRLFISHLKQFTMNIDMHLIAVYDIKGNAIHSTLE